MRDAHEIDEIMLEAMPSGAMEVASAFRTSGFPCHAVGGCVRDSLMGREPHDWDMTTSATVDEMRESLHAMGISTYDTGVAHGTITAVPSDGQSYEVTTYRVDGTYSDGRHPDRVTFTDSLEKDLARRDLTINAIAWSPAGGIVDPFGGVKDIASGTIRAVGIPTDRMHEDGLRVMRAVRFSATLGFAIEPETDAAIISCVPMLDKVSWERKRDELEKMLVSSDPTALAVALRRHSDVIFAVIPELAPCVTTPQQHEWHRFDNVWDHTVEVVANAPTERCVRLAALFHDIGKPSCLEIHEDGRTSFLGHPAVSASVTEGVLTRLRFDTKTVKHVLLLVREHDRHVAPTRKSVCRTIVRLGSEETFQEWLSLRRADVMGQSEHAQAIELPRLAKVKELADATMRDEGLFSMSDMLLRGQDLLDLGMSPGPAVGDILREAFALVVDGRLPNERDALLEFAVWRITYRISDL